MKRIVLAGMLTFTGTVFGAGQYTVERLAPPAGSSQDWALAVSSAGAVGNSYVNGTARAVLWQGGQGVLLPGPDGVVSSARGVNVHGAVVGGMNSASSSVPVLWQGGLAQTLDTLGLPGGSATAINDSGTVVGALLDAESGLSYAVRWDGGQATVLGNFPDEQALATAINNSGQIVLASSGGGHSESWVLNNGTLIQIPDLGGHALTGRSINGSGHIVGDARLSDGGSAEFLWDGGATTALPDFGDDNNSVLRAINDADQIVGSGFNPMDGLGARLWESGAVFDLNDLIPSGSGWKLIEASGIDNHGRIVGVGSLNGATAAFMLTPTASASPNVAVPEAGSLFVLGLGAVGWVRMRRRHS